MARTPTVRVRCLVSRMIGDDSYGAGEIYRMDAERAARYAALGYFEILDAPKPDAEPEPDEASSETEKQAESPANKMRGRPEDKAG